MFWAIIIFETFKLPKKEKQLEKSLFNFWEETTTFRKIEAIVVSELKDWA